ncbi:PREDICTED: coiled-coil domain-containing protein 129 [Nanorana parkeri]|uniref:coiled-coil domain-containing protein 129 n=1 Tax=Nanorana parkeri TaxID=125878 RepID=UPI000854FE0F|nr:PREDICTED: coiled-coil domain-containing protein 129 [Nanorana parkeri]
METPPAAKWDGNAKHATFNPPTSVTEVLKLCEADPAELLIDLGFGIDEPDICTKIPTRFIMAPSAAKGINTRVFLDAQKRRMEIEHPNLCGRFRQLEVLEQVTSAFSSLLKDVHFIQNGENKNVKKSTLTQEKRKRIRQLLWKFSRQVKIVDENPGPCVDSDELTENQDQREPLKDTANVNIFRKRRHSTDQGNAEVLSKEQLPTTDNANVSPSRPEAQLCSLSAPVKQYSLPEMSAKIRTLRGSKVLSKTFRQASTQNRLQPPDSFEMEEVQSFEEDYPKALIQDRISDLTRTSSCQSDSSGFQDDPLEPLPLKNLHGSSDSIDSQVTLREKSNSSDFPDISEEHDVHDFTEDATITSTSCSIQTGKDAYKSLSMHTENSDDIFQSFESHNDHADNMKEMDKQRSIAEDSENEIEEITNGVNYMDGEPEDHMDQRQTLTPVSSEVEYPVYVTHYLSDIRKIHTEFYSETNDDQDYFGGHVSHLQVKSDSESNSFADDECSVVSSSAKWTSSLMNGSQSFSFNVQTPPGSVDYSDHELHHCYQDKKSTFQTEINTNIYKSVTIQMSSNLLQDPGECTSRQHSVYNTNNNKSEVHALFTCVADKKDAFTQTEIGWLNECYTNNHCFHQQSRFSTESLSLDTGLLGHHHSSHPAFNISCCHCCHCHHCCVSRCPSMCRHNVPNRPSSSCINIEKELSDTLSLLRGSLISISLSKKDDMENMKKACQTYRERILEIEQHLLEQQAGCFNILTSEERENIRRLHLIRRDVLKEATELEFNLDERARHVKEAISVQLEQVLEEQSRLYSELEFCDLDPESSGEGHSRNLYKSQSAPSTSTLNVPEEDPKIKANIIEAGLPSQKIDFSTILQNIKKTFRSFNN